jgi:hypothetical protein
VPSAPPLSQTPTAAPASKSKKKVNCDTCDEEYDAATAALWASTPLSQGCKHARMTCDDCVRNHIAAEITLKGAYRPITCPHRGCDEALDQAVIQTLATVPHFKTYERLQLQHGLESIAEFRWCAHAGCGNGWLVDEGDLYPLLRCRACNERTCYQHRVLWHEGLTCDQYEAQMRVDGEHASENWILQFTKPCPKCARNIEKNDGCDHMTCSLCSHEFCWHCFAPYQGAEGIWTVGNSVHKPSCKYRDPGGD